jgi:hypothetical protein
VTVKPIRIRSMKRMTMIIMMMMTRRRMTRRSWRRIRRKM